MMRFTDALSRELHLPERPTRIVSLVPSLTEALCALGLESDLVGVTKFCVHPAHIRGSKTVIGGTKTVHAEKIAALRPDIIIANREENTPEIVAGLEPICPVWVTDIASMEDNLTLLAEFGAVFNRRAEASRWIAKIESAWQAFLCAFPNIPSRRTAYLIWKSPWMAAGKGTFIDSMMELNGFENIFRAPRYPQFELPELKKPDPEIVLLSSEPFPFKEEHAFEIGRFTHHAKVIFVDGEMFSWYGTRPARAFAYFTELQRRLQ